MIQLIDSILSIQIVSRLKQSGLTLSVKQLFQQQTVAQLASIANTTHRIVAPQEKLSGTYVLGPIQHWFFETFTTCSQHFNQSVYLHVSQQVAGVTLEQAIQKLVEHHDLLRSKFLTASDNVEISQAIIKASENNLFPYGQPQGNLSFRESIAKHYKSNKSSNIHADQVLATNSAAGP